MKYFLIKIKEKSRIFIVLTQIIIPPPPPLPRKTSAPFGDPHSAFRLELLVQPPLVLCVLRRRSMLYLLLGSTARLVSRHFSALPPAIFVPERRRCVAIGTRPRLVRNEHSCCDSMDTVRRASSLIRTLGEPIARSGTILHKRQQLWSHAEAEVIHSPLLLQF